MFGRKICPKCETGARSYMIDSNSPECPYISCYKKGKCAMFVKADKPKKRIFGRVLRKKQDSE